MFNIDSSLRALFAAEKVNSSKNLTDADKIVLLKAIAASVIVSMPGTPDHSLVVHASIERMSRNERSNIANAARTEVEGRTTEGVENPPAVVAERTEEGSEEATGSPEGITKSPEDGDRAASAPSGTAAPKAYGRGKAKTKA